MSSNENASGGRRTRPAEVPSIKPGTKDMENYLAAGYGMNKAEAEAIIAEYKENPLTHPYERYEKAQAFLAALTAKPQVVSKTPGWRRSRGVY